MFGVRSFCEFRPSGSSTFGLFGERSQCSGKVRSWVLFGRRILQNTDIILVARFGVLSMFESSMFDFKRKFLAGKFG